MRLIDADALYDDVMERYCKDCEKRKGMKRGKRRMIYEIGEAPCRACYVDDVKMELDEAPTIDAESVRCGKWKHIEEYKGAGFGFLKCSVCGNPLWFTTKYCPNCGAKMEGVEE